MTDIREIRVAQLQRALKEAGGKKAELARAIGKAPAQLSQWFSGYRTIEEDSAREIERKLRKPHGWLDSLDNPNPGPPHLRETPAPYGLAAALVILGQALEAPDLTDEKRDEISDALHQMVKRHGAARYQRLILELLSAKSGKQTRVA
jgi:transcriptional regulator with XRE-family HTH domain